MDETKHVDHMFCVRSEARNRQHSGRHECRLIQHDFITMAVHTGSPCCLIWILIATVSLVAGDIDINLEIVEEQPKGAMVINLKNAPEVREHFEKDELKKISFRFLDPAKGDKIKQYFSVEEWTGILSFAQVLDRDVPDVCRGLERCQINLDIAVNPGAAAFTIIHVTIDLLDLNDNAPTFPTDRVTKSVMESVAPGLLLPIVPASDPDSPNNGIVAYELTESGPFRLKTEWNQDGSVELNLMLTSLLDREQEDQYTLNVIAKDGGIPSRSGSVVIELTVNDKNDNSPVFEKSVYRVRVWENSDINMPLVTVRAVDGDAGDNGRVFYSFTKMSGAQYGSLFSIGRETGQISLLEPLDHESKQSIRLGVMAKDQGVGSRPAYTTVEIMVLDRNDNEPSISLATSDPLSGNAVSLTEHSPRDTFVVHISVGDPDAGDAGRIDCSIDDEVNFHLKQLYDKEYNIVTRSDIDREVASQYILALECFDHGEPSLTTSTSVIVVVKDINDHGPVFEKIKYEVILDENSSRHTSVVKVAAHDADADENGRIIYMLDEDAGDDFQIDPATGLITSIVPLDHEKIPFREFHVIAMDNAADPKYGRTLVSLTIRDADDESPTFEQKKYIFSVPEGLPARTEVGKVKATDSDGPPYNNFTYYLDGSQNDLRLFQIDHNTGMIFTRRELDRELRDLYHLIAVAQSNTVPRKSDTAQVDIHITDRNDNQPQITFPKYGNETIYLSNAVPTGYTVTTVEATDPDFGSNAELVYSISQGNENGEFTIRPSAGDILVNKPLADYDNVVFKLVIMVQDGGTPKKITVQTLNVVVAEMNFTLAESGPAYNGRNGITTSSSVPLIVGVIAGCVLISLILIIAIVMMKRKHRKKPPGKSNQFWSENETADKVKDANDLPMTLTSNVNKAPLSDIAAVVKSDILKQSQLQVGKDDSDSGCADVSHAESQGSNEDPDGYMQKHGSEMNNIVPFNHSPPQRMDSFTTWLHSESYNLNQKGNVYRVSEQNREHGANSPAATLPNPKKTVRFSEPQEHINIPSNCSDDSSLPPPPEEFSHNYYDNQDAFYGDQIGGVGYENDGAIVVIPEKSTFTTFHDGSLV
ncbi:hypothetical protein LSH36_1067g00036 [Paralvinella palmiformis]|uniref:Cadherin domain-containing protein n=1 Tax=Paralvinella palmiformis TaxID=53620 RepID=A0AAD9IVZ5_9ANNE|nr:hypothetical protein LSH36_1067g00036 [Paralvinella palmiformis]